MKFCSVLSVVSTLVIYMPFQRQEASASPCSALERLAPLTIHPQDLEKILAGLSNKEKAILWIRVAQKKTEFEAAEFLGMSYRNIQEYLRKLKWQFGQDIWCLDLSSVHWTVFFSSDPDWIPSTEGIQKKIDSLNPREKLVLRARMEWNISNNQIAHSLGINPGGASRIFSSTERKIGFNPWLVDLSDVHW